MTVSIMTLGDSITAGTGGYNYRMELDPQLRGAGITADFVGSQFDGTYQHEGHPGYTIEQVAASIDGWLAAAGEPQIITLMIGTNDMGPGIDPGPALTALQALADQIFGDDPTADLIISKIPPLTDGSEVDQFNAGIADIVTTERSHGHAAFEVDPALTVGDLSADHVHPNQGGYVKIGDAFAAGVESALGIGTPPGDGTVSASGLHDDFNGDGTSDVLVRDTSGNIIIATMQNGADNLDTPVGLVDPSWYSDGVADFGGDHKADILWRNDNGAVAMWQMDGAAITSNTVIAGVGGVDRSWYVPATGDFDGDGKADILWRNDNGALAMWQMNGATVAGNATLAGVGGVDKSWYIPATGDFNGDGKADIIWRNDNGAVVLWEMNGTQLAHNLTITGVGGVDASWHIAGTGDFNGDGTSDILWHNDNGAVVLWEMQNGAIAANLTAAGVGSMSPGAGWHVAATGDYNGDGKADILWHNDNGQTALWTMDGGRVTAQTQLASLSSPDWHVT